MNSDLQIDANEAAAESPALTTDLHDIETHVWVGGDERPAFLNQARWLGEAWRCPVTIAPGKHHFDVIEELEDPQSTLVDTLLD